MTYSSPFTGKTYFIDWNSNWMFQHEGAGSNVESTVTTSTTTVKPILLSHVGPKDIHVKWEWSYNKGMDTTTTTTTKSSSTTSTTSTEPSKIKEENIDTRSDAFTDDIQNDDKSNDIDPTASLE